MAVSELRLALTVENYDEALAFYRDALGLELLDAWSAPGGNVAILDAGRATLELLDAGRRETVDELEVGRRVAGPVRVALEVAGLDGDGGAARGSRRASALGGPVETPWRHRNVACEAPDGMQLTLFTVLAVTLDVERLRADTPGCAHVAHLNNAGSSLPPRPVLDAVVEHLQRESEIGGYEAYAERLERIEHTYDALARLIGAAPRRDRRASRTRRAPGTWRSTRSGSRRATAS